MRVEEGKARADPLEASWISGPSSLSSLPLRIVTLS
jgi:hypothetical protein